MKKAFDLRICKLNHLRMFRPLNDGMTYSIVLNSYIHFNASCYNGRDFDFDVRKEFDNIIYNVVKMPFDVYLHKLN